MKAMSKAFRKHKEREDFYSEVIFYGAMNLDWLKELNIPAAAKVLWFEFLDKPTRNSISVDVEMQYLDFSIWLSTGTYDSSIYESEFTKRDWKKLMKVCPRGKGIKLHLQVWYRE